MKKWVSVMLAIVFAFGLTVMLSSGNVVSAYTSYTADEAVAWLNSIVGTTRGDGACVALIKDYYEYLGVSSVKGNANTYATDSNKVPPGWTRIANATPQKGDVMVWIDGLDGCGHVAICGGDGVYFHQNFGGQYVRALTKSYTNGFSVEDDYANYWGVIRPDFASSSISYSTIDESVYYLKNKATDLYLNVSYGTDAQAQNVDLVTFNNSTATQFQVYSSPTPSGYALRPLCSTSRLLNVYADTVASGKNVCIYDDVSDGTQRWEFEKVSGGYKIHNVQNPSCVLAEDAYYNAYVTTSADDDMQVWVLENTVEYDANGGSGAPERQFKTYDESLVLSDTVPVREGYTFKGWSTLANTTVAAYQAGETYTANENLNLYAVWEKAAETGTHGNFSYSILDGEVTITDYSGTAAAVEIPSSIKGYPVTEIGWSAFFNCQTLKSVSIPDSVTSIGYQAFEECRNLKTVEMPENLTFIDQHAFASCVKLESMDLPSGVTNIEAGAFDGCSSLKNVTLPDVISILYVDTFNGCSSLTDVWYTGSESDRNYLTITPGNEALTSATWHYNTCTGEHTYETAVAKKATLTANGATQKACSVCGKVASTQTIPYVKTVSLSATSYTYNGTVRTPSVVVKNAAGKTLTKDTDYTVTYASGRKNVGTYKVTVTMKGNYSGSKTLTFKINPIDISKCAVKLSTTSYTYNGAVRTPSVTVKNQWGTTLTKDKHYTVTYASGRKNAGTYKVTFTMKGNYSGSKMLTFKINPIKISNCKVSLSTTAYTYNGAVRTPSVTVKNQGGTTLTKDKHYTVTYASGRKNAGTYKVTVTMKGNYSGSKTLTFKINPIDISKCAVKLSTTSYTYNGAVRTPSVTVKNQWGTTLTKDKHYTVTYAIGRKNAGTYKVTVTMKGNYSGSKTLTFKINPIKISNCKVSLSTTAYTYNGAVRTPSVTVKNQWGTTLTKDKHYTVTYSSGRKNVGTYKVTVKMKGNYSGTKTLTFTIKPPKTTVSKVTAGKSKLTVSIAKKTTQVSGYQVQYSTSKKFTNAKTKTISSHKTTSTTLSGLSAKKTYYVRVRTYKTVNGVKDYSGWSSAITKKTQ